MSTPSLERLTAQFTDLIGPEAFAKAAAAAEAAKVAAAEAAKAAAAKAAAEAAAKAAAAAAAPKPATPIPPGTSTTSPAVAGPAAAIPASPAATAGLISPKPAAPAAAKPAAAPAAPAAPRPVPAPAAPPPPPASPLQATAHAAKGYDLDATVAPQQVAVAATLLDRAGFGLDAITGVDWIAQNEMEVVYDYFHPIENIRVVVRARLPRATPQLPTIVPVFPGANWHERETHDFFGIEFTGHPNLKPFLLPEDANFHPLRKDYAP